MKTLIICLFTVLGVQAFSQTIIDDKNVEVRSIQPFVAIKASSGIDIYLSQSNECAVAVSASDVDARNAIRTEVKNGVLSIWFDGSKLRLNGNKKLRAYVSFKSLESIEGSGACDFIISDNYKATASRIKLSGACEMKGQINIENLQMDLSGASTVNVKGAVKNLKIEASGASDFKNYNLVADNLIANVSGASDVKITVTNSISGKASGASAIYYKGTPQTSEISASGASQVAQRN